MAAKILVVDDDANVQRLLSYTLKQEGYEVVVAARRRRGLQAVERRSRRRSSCSTSMLPKLDGYQVATKIRAEEGQARPRPDHHAHRRERGRAEDPRAAGRAPTTTWSSRSTRPSSWPGSRASSPGSRPSDVLVGRPPLGPRPRVLRGQGRRRHDDDRDQRGDRAPPRAGPPGLPRGRQPPVRRPPGLPRPRPGPQEHRGRRHARRRSTRTSLRNIVVKHDSGVDLLLAPPSPETAELVTPAHMRQILERAPRPVRLRDRRHRQAARRREPGGLRRGRPDLRGHDRRPLVPQERAARPRDARPPRLRAEQGQARPQPLERVHRHQRQERRGRPQAARSSSRSSTSTAARSAPSTRAPRSCSRRRTRRSGAPFHDFARAIDKAPRASAAAEAPARR